MVLSGIEKSIHKCKFILLKNTCLTSENIIFLSNKLKDIRFVTLRMYE